MDSVDPSGKADNPALIMSIMPAWQGELRQEARDGDFQWEQNHPVLATAAVFGAPALAAVGVETVGGSAVGEGLIAAGRAAGEAGKTRLIAMALHWVLHQGVDMAEHRGIAEAEHVVTQEATGAIQGEMERGASEGLGKLVGRAGQKTLQSMAAATAAAKGYDSVKINSNGTVTGKYTPIGTRIAVSTTCGNKGCTTN